MRLTSQKTPLQLTGNILLLGLSAGLFFYFQPYYILRNFSLVLGLIFAPFIFRTINKIPSNRFFVPALAFGLLLFFIKTNTFFYAFWVCLILFLWESQKGQLNNLPVFLFFVLSFVSQQILNNWSFPIRLKLSALAGKTIQLLGYPIEVVGNMIYMDGQPFSVDPACMGLKMMVTAQLLALLILVYYERKNLMTFSIITIAINLLLVMILTVAANFSRLVALVIFQILPENPLHDIIGLISLIFYVLLPFYFGLKILFQKGYFQQQSILKSSPKRTYIWTLWLFALFVYQGVQSKQVIPKFDLLYPLEKFTNFQQSTTKNGILKLENEHTLVYIKPPVSFFQGSHDPRVCWQGSGYEFKNIKVEKIADTDVYTAILSHSEGQFYTAWWYDNLDNQTIDEWQWRLDGLQGEKGYFLVNVSSLSRSILLEQVRTLLK